MVEDVAPPRIRNTKVWERFSGIVLASLLAKTTQSIRGKPDNKLSHHVCPMLEKDKQLFIYSLINLFIFINRGLKYKFIKHIFLNEVLVFNVFNVW